MSDEFSPDIRMEDFSDIEIREEDLDEGLRNASDYAAENAGRARRNPDIFDAFERFYSSRPGVEARVTAGLSTNFRPLQPEFPQFPTLPPLVLNSGQGPALSDPSRYHLTITPGTRDSPTDLHEGVEIGRAHV